MCVRVVDDPDGSVARLVAAGADAQLMPVASAFMRRVLDASADGNFFVHRPMQLVVLSDPCKALEIGGWTRIALRWAVVGADGRDTTIFVKHRPPGGAVARLVCVGRLTEAMVTEWRLRDETSVGFRIGELLEVDELPDAPSILGHKWLSIFNDEAAMGTIAGEPTIDALVDVLNGQSRDHGFATCRSAHVMLVVIAGFMDDEAAGEALLCHATDREFDVLEAFAAEHGAGELEQAILRGECSCCGSSVQREDGVDDAVWLGELATLARSRRLGLSVLIHYQLAGFRPDADQATLRKLAAALEATVRKTGFLRLSREERYDVRFKLDDIAAGSHMRSRLPLK